MTWDLNVSEFFWGHIAFLAISYQSTASASDEDLTHDDQPDVDIRLAEMDHEARPKKTDGHAKEQRLRFEATSLGNQDTCSERPDTRADVVDIANVQSLSFGQVRNDQ